VFTLIILPEHSKHNVALENNFGLIRTDDFSRRGKTRLLDGWSRQYKSIKMK